MRVSDYTVICYGERTGRVMLDDDCHNIYTAQDVYKRLKKLGYTNVCIHDNRRGAFIHTHPVFGIVR
jgi:hypothetical protein